MTEIAKNKDKNQVPHSAMVLAAGLGKRMRSFSSHIPKPMVEVAGVSLINRVLDKLHRAGVKNAVVNLHHKAALLEAHLAERQGGLNIIISHEKTTLLETGGGVKNALPLLGKDPFFVINSDALWDDGDSDTLAQMSAIWQSKKMDVLLLLLDTQKLTNFTGAGDFNMDATGALSRPLDGKQKPFVFTGVQIINPAIMENFADGVFSLNKVYDQAQKNNRLFGMAHKGMWHHVGSGEEVDIAEKFYTKK